MSGCDIYPCILVRNKYITEKSHFNCINGNTCVWRNLDNIVSELRKEQEMVTITNYYWLVREWFNKTLNRMSRYSVGIDEIWFRENRERVMKDFQYVAIYRGTYEQCAALAYLRDRDLIDKELDRQRILSEMEKLK